MENCEIAIKELHCNNCGWTWYPRSPKRPGVCPSCKSHEWDNVNKFPNTQVKLRICADAKMMRALNGARERGVTYKGKPVSDELAYEVGAKFLLDNGVV